MRLGRIVTGLVACTLALVVLLLAVRFDWQLAFSRRVSALPDPGCVLQPSMCGRAALLASAAAIPCHAGLHVA